MGELKPTAGLGQSRAYWLFGAVFVFLAAVLWLSQQMDQLGPGPGPAISEARPPAAQATAVTAVQALSNVIEKRVHDPKQVADRSGFAEGMQRLAVRLNAERFDTLPPAAKPSDTDAIANLGPPVTLSRLSVATPEGLPVPPKGQSLRLEIASREKRESVHLTGFPKSANLMLEDGAMLTVAVVIFEPSSFFGLVAGKHELWTNTARIAANDIRTRGPLQLKLTGQRPLREGAPVESVTVDLGIQPTRFNPRANTIESKALRAGPTAGVAVHKAKPGALEGWVERVVVPAAGSKTYALVWRDQRGAGAAEVLRTDGEPPIGIAAPGLPLLAAAADGWASLAITLANNPRRDGAGFLVAAATGDSGAAEALFLEFAAKLLHELTADGAPLSASESARALIWVRMGFALPPEPEASLLERLSPDVAAALRRALTNRPAR